MGSQHERRDRARIYAEILEKIRRASDADEKLTITRVQTELNVPFVRFREYIDDLKKKKLIIIETKIALTERGLEYLKEYGKVREFLEKFGMIRPIEDDDQIN